MNNTSVAEKEALLLSGEKQLKNFGSFLDNHRKMMNKFNSRDDQNKNKYYKINRLSIEQMGPIRLQYNFNQENVSYFQLCESDNKILNKILIVFAQLCDTSRELVKTSSSFQKKFLFYDEDLGMEENHDENQNYTSLVKISEILSFLFELKNFVQQCLVIAHNLLKQLGALFNLEKFYMNLQSSIYFRSVFDSIGDLLLEIIIFDEVLQNSNIAKYWSTYRKTVRSVQMNCDQFGNKYDPETLGGLDNVLSELEEIFGGRLVQNAIDLFCTLKNEIDAKAFGVFTGHFQNHLKIVINEIQKYSTELSEFDETRTIIKSTAMSVLYHNLCGNLDQRIFKHLIDVNNKYCCITLVGDVIWSPAPFIKKHSETLLKGHDRYVTDSKRVQQNYLTNRVNLLIKDTQIYCIQITGWILRFTDVVRCGGHDWKMEELRNRCTLILEGIQYAGQLSHIIKSVTNLHIAHGVKMQKNCLLSICKLIEFLKLVIVSFQRHMPMVVEMIQCVVQYLQYQALFVVANTKKRIAHDTLTYSEKSLDILSAMQVIEKCLFGAATRRRLIVTRLAMSATDPVHTFSADYLQKLEKALSRLESIVSFQENLEAIGEPTFLYWHQSLLPIYLRQAMEQNVDLLKIGYLLSCIDDCGHVLRSIETNGFKCLDTFNSSVKDELKSTIIQKICHHIETYLRLDIHSNLQVNPVDPFTDSEYRDYRKLIKMRPIQLAGGHHVIKDKIEHYLSAMFYNLTTISLHDWRTYGEMRQLATLKFDLQTVDDHLPTQTLEQGLDVLEIMRNIHVFVSRYVYNLNNQIFIEVSSNNKHLNTINIRHIANSLRTHGTGIINTTVNFTYQFLRKKFFTFSQFMCDEHIKSRLMKDLKYFRESRDKNNVQMYGYERADAFNKGIRKLGMSPTGESYLDLFRQLISNIGNAMGYVRMIRSGGLHMCANASVFLPTLDEELVFRRLSEEEGFSTATLDAAENLENAIKNLTNNYTQGTDYFKLLVDAFAPFFRNPNHIHLRNFYLIVPPLTINFIDHILTSKDKMFKKNKDGALFTDDGFAMGLAYILKLLDQTDDFNSLHWFKAIRMKYARERQVIREQRVNLVENEDDKLQHTLTLTEKRIQNMQQEYDLLYFNLSSAKIFFK